MSSKRTVSVALVVVALGALAQTALAKGKPAVKEPAAAEAAAPAPAPAPSGHPGDPQKFIAGLYTRLDQMSQNAKSVDELHGRIGQELTGIVDYVEMGRLTLGAKWNDITEPQRKEFTGLLSGMVVNTYVRRFKPGTAIEISYAAAPKALSEGKVQVQTTIKVKKTSADVHYDLLPRGGQWAVYDILVDDASQVQTYRQSFKKILDKEGWPGLMTRMRKAAEKKVG